MTRFTVLLALLLATGLSGPAHSQPASDPSPAAPSGAEAPEYTIHALRYATIADFPVASLVMGAPEGETLDIAMVFWLVRGGDRTILFDTGFHREEWFDRFAVEDYVRPDRLLAEVGVEAAEVTDVVVSHAHWDHMGGIDLFPEATVWIQEEEYRYYTGPAWREGGNHGGIDDDDILALVRMNARGRVRAIPGDDVEILPGIRVYTGARHTYASQYVRVAGDPPYVLASDNCYLYRNLEESAPVATIFRPEDAERNLRAQRRMVELAGSAARVVPGHDPLQFERFAGEGRVVRIR